jgi:hypothetical protein
VPDDPLADVARLEGVPSAIGASRDAVDAVLRDRGLRTVSPEQSATALVAAARASALLALEEDEWAIQQQSIEAAAVRLYTEIVQLAGLIRVAPGQAIARAHALLGRGLLDDDQLGRPRPGQQVADRMSGIYRLLAEPTAAPMIAVAGIAHAELVSCRPFQFGSGIVARAVEHMVLIDGGIDTPAVTVPEAGHQPAAEPTNARQQIGYRAALDEYRAGNIDGVRHWLLHVADAVARGAELSPLQHT